MIPFSQEHAKFLLEKATTLSTDAMTGYLRDSIRGLEYTINFKFPLYRNDEKFAKIRKQMLVKDYLAGVFLSGIKREVYEVFPHIANCK